MLPVVAWFRRLPPNVQGALWLVSGGFIFTGTGVMIRILSEQIESVQTAFFRAVLSLIMLLPMILSGRVVPWHSKRIAGHFWRTAAEISPEGDNLWISLSIRKHVTIRRESVFIHSEI